MKAVILEIKQGIAAVLAEDGTVQKVKLPTNGSYLTGDTIDTRDFKKAGSNRKLIQRGLVAAAAVLLIVGITVGVYTGSSQTVYAMVTLDGADIEYELNRENQVIAVNALSEEAESIVEALQAEGIKYQDIEMVIGRTTELLHENDRLTPDQDLSVTVTAKRGKAPAELEDTLDTVISEKKDMFLQQDRPADLPDHEGMEPSQENGINVESGGNSGGIPGENPEGNSGSIPGENPIGNPGGIPDENSTGNPGGIPGENPTGNPGGIPGENPTGNPGENSGGIMPNGELQPPDLNQGNPPDGRDTGNSGAFDNSQDTSNLPSDVNQPVPPEGNQLQSPVIPQQP